MPYDELDPLSVSEASSLLHTLISESFYQITIKGEVAGFHPSSTGHWYFSLKDESALINAAIFRNAQYNMPLFKNGDEVIAKGRIDYYEKGGKITFIIEKLTLKGDGELLLRIEKRKEYYKSIGWFDLDLKKKLPNNIKKIGVVTSLTGAALQDILNITKRRAPGIDILVFPTAVQGDGADISIASRIRQANNFMACDVLIVTRGGGSVEDLAPFSEDNVVVAIHESVIPVISAVGHEIDWPISDYVADLRAPTPSSAAELATEESYNRALQLKSAESTIELLISSKVDKIKNRLNKAKNPIDEIKHRILAIKHSIPDIEDLTLYLKRRYDRAEFRLSMAEDDIQSALIDRTKDAKQRLKEEKKEQLLLIRDRVKDAQRLIKERKNECDNSIKVRTEKTAIRLAAIKRETKGLSPFSILKRGYAVVEDQNGKVIKDSKTLKAGDTIRTRLYKGEFYSKVEEIK